MKKIIPCLFTSGNLSFGVLSMMMTLHGEYVWAGICILLAVVCDACDGRSARALGVAGEFGKELDSLSDVVSFGAASAFLIYTYSLQTLGWVGAIPAIIYAALGGIRLARFNLNTGVISGAVLPAWLVAILVVLLGYNLVSQIHHPDFKGASPDVLHKSALAIAVIIGALVLYVDWHLVITLPFLLYIIFGLVNTAMNVAAAR